MEAALILSNHIETKRTKSLFPQEGTHQTIKALFNKAIINKDHANEDLIKSTSVKFSAFIDQEVPYKRGLGIYTSSQLKAYHTIKEKLQNGQLVTISSRKQVGRNQLIRIYLQVSQYQKAWLAAMVIMSLIASKEVI